MKSERSKKRKQLKAAARRKDYTKKRNINRNNNRQSAKFENPVYRSTTEMLREPKGGWKGGEVVAKVSVEKVGEKSVRITYPAPVMKPGNGILPKSRKFTLSKREIIERRKIAINTMSDVITK